MNRKEFIQTTYSLCGLGILSALAAACRKTDKTPQGPTVNFTLDLNAVSNSALSSVGGFVYSNGVIVACTAPNTYAAIAQTCTHESCTITYSSSTGNFPCPCHGGVFNSKGEVLSGPPQIAVKNYAVTKNGNSLTVAG